MPPELLNPVTMFGQGKRVTTLLTEDGCHYPVIAPNPYLERRYLQSAPFSSPENRGHRRHSLHDTTFKLGDRRITEFLTTTKENYGGSKSLNPCKVPLPSRSMHKSQLQPIITNKYSDDHGGGDWGTDYTKTYFNKDIIPANRLHLKSFDNKRSQTGGTDMCNIVRPTTSVATYWSQYGRIHNKLGSLLGPGVPRGYPIRQQYNIVTGESNGSAWKNENHRTSGNRVLHSCRKTIETTPIIS